MTIAAQSIIRRATDLLLDPSSVRWAVGELVRYLNDGQREIAMYRPDATATTAAVTLAAGTKQVLPATGAKLIDVIRNTAGTKRVVRQTDRTILDAQLPNWYNLTGVVEIAHYMYDPRDPKVFYVYPPAASEGASIEMVYSAYPTDITEPSSGTYSAVSGNISIADTYANALTDYVLYRAFAKDSEVPNSATRAQAFYGAFANAMGIEMNGTSGVVPKA